MLKPDRRRAAVTSADITRQEEALEALKSRLQRQEYDRIHIAAQEAGIDLAVIPHQSLVDALKPLAGSFRRADAHTTGKAKARAVAIERQEKDGG